jgi:hypothetical protein
LSFRWRLSKAGGQVVPRFVLLSFALYACSNEPAPAGVGADAATAGPGVPTADREAVRAWLVEEGEADRPDPRTAADLLFNDAMMASETGDPSAASLLPRAVAAWEALPDRDADGDFHLAVLQQASGQAQAAMATVDRGLKRAPSHLLLLGVGLRAARDPGGDPAKARVYARQLLDAWEGEQGTRAEYAHHDLLLPVFQAEAAAAVE